MELDELDDPDFGDVSDLRRQARAQVLIVKHFWTRWKQVPYCPERDLRIRLL